MTAAQALTTAALCAMLGACGSGQYDQQREWALQECDKILDPDDRHHCRQDTPHYVR